MIKILIGGSPCTHWSIAQKNNRETEAEGLGWELFKNFLVAKEKFKPDFFLYENNKSAAQPIKDQISKELGVELQYINSALVSAQNRQRFYAHNIPNVPQPADRGILLRDILESGQPLRNEKSYCLDANYYKGGNLTNFEKQSGKRLMVAEPVALNDQEGKSRTLKAQYAKTSIANLNYTASYGATMVAEPIKPSTVANINPSGRGINGNVVHVNGKSLTLTTNKGEGPKIAEPVRIVTIENDAKNKDHDSKQYRVYSPDGKSTTICGQGGGVGAKTGLYACPIKELIPYTEKKIAEIVEKYGYLPENFNPYHTQEIENKAPTITASSNRQSNSGQVMSVLPSTNQKPIYQVKDSLITIKGNTYPIKLADGLYIIRKLTVTECCRLQTMPDDYCRAVSASQGYKGLGNGWTAEVIIHILKHMNIPLDEEIVVLSMYDGIGTGRYCFDQLGYKNIKYYAYEIDKYAKQVAMSNYPDIIQCGDTFQVRDEGWKCCV